MKEIEESFPEIVHIKVKMKKGKREPHHSISSLKEI